MSIERRFLDISGSNIEVRETEGQPSKIIGYASVFFKENDSTTEFKQNFGQSEIIERIMPGCFDEALKNNADVRCLFNHDPNFILGRSKAGTLLLSQDERGLRYEVLSPSTSAGRDILESIKRGDLTGSSFSFKVEKQEFRDLPNGSYIREIQSVKLYDVGPVTFPAYEGTNVTSRDDSSAIKDLEKELKAKAQSIEEQQKRCKIALRKIEICEKVFERIHYIYTI